MKRRAQRVTTNLGSSATGANYSELVAQVRELIARGLVLTAIGGVLSVSDGRVRQLAAL